MEKTKNKIKNKKLLFSIVISAELVLISILLITISSIVFNLRYTNFFESKDTSIFWCGALLVMVLIIGCVVMATSLTSLIMNISKYKDVKKGK